MDVDDGHRDANYTRGKDPHLLVISVISMHVLELT